MISVEQGIDLSGVHATTHFSTDANARNVTMANSGSTSGYEIMSNMDWSKVGLHNLLSQPIVIARGTIVPETEWFDTWRSHTTPLQSSSFHVEKLKGYMGIRATCVARLVVNADKYTQGRVALSFLPGDTNVVYKRRDHRLVTQLPHVELDLNTDTEVTLEIPHRGPYSHYDFLNAQYDVGRFQVSTLLPIRGSSFSYTIYHTFKDIDLMGPTTAEQNVSYQGDLMTIEEENRPMSQKIKDIGSAMTTMSMVPMIGSYIAPLAWAIGIAGNVMSAFGWSRPITTLTPHVYKDRPIPKFNHSDGTDYAEVLATTVTSSVRPSEQIGFTVADEMAYDYLLGIKSTLVRLTYNVTTPVGTRLVSFPLCPGAMQAQSEVASAKIMHPMCFLANNFQSYRGAIEVTFELAKTIFHTGRLMVVFEPSPSNLVRGGTVQSRVDTLDKAINCHKDVIDIRKGNSFSFQFPYTALVPYMPVEQPYGYVHVFVVNALVRNDTAVEPNVDIAVKVNGCPGFEFQGPCMPRYFPFEPELDTTTVSLTQNDTIPGLAYESGLEAGDSVIVTKPIGAAKPFAPDNNLAQLCVGENLRSVKQIAMRSKIVWTGSSTLLPPNIPFSIDTFYQPLDVTPTNTVAPLHDYYSMIGAMYAYSRGGVVMTMISKGGFRLSFNVCYDPYRWTSGFNDNEFALAAYIEGTSDRYYIPPCDNSFCRYNYGVRDYAVPNTGSGDNLGREYDHGFSKARFFIRNTSNGLDGIQSAYLARAAAEDTQFGGFRGVPYMQLRSPYYRFVDLTPLPDVKVSAFTFNNT